LELELSSFARRSSLASYQSTQAHGGVAAADAHGLVLMLLDGATERMATARGCIEHGDTVRKAKLLHSCITIIAELRGSLNMTEGGSLAKNLSDLYAYMMQQLLKANVTSDAALVTEVLGLLGDIRAGWVAIGPAVRVAGTPAAA
jgi:flagellar secretion chaperone FliS